MKSKLKNGEDEIKFDWMGFFAFWLGLELPLFALSFYASFYIVEPAIPVIIRKLLLCIAPIILMAFFRHYNWKNIFLALVLIITTLHPIRFLYHWRLNPILYAVLTLICMRLLLNTLQKFDWKSALVTLLIACVILSGWQTILSTAQINYCFVDDSRYTDYYVCDFGVRGWYPWYQQIQSLPISMKHWCYYCPWHRGVSW